jgi:Ferritin-like domain
MLMPVTIQALLLAEVSYRGKTLTSVSLWKRSRVMNLRTCVITGASSAKRQSTGQKLTWAVSPRRAKAAGLGDNFDPFANEMNFFLGGMLMEDVGVTAYHGATTLIKSKEFLDAAAGILAVEAYHMGMARSVLYQMGAEARDAANALSDARDKLDGQEDVDQGIVMDGKANIVPSKRTARHLAARLNRCSESFILLTNRVSPAADCFRKG